MGSQFNQDAAQGPAGDAGAAGGAQGAGGGASKEGGGASKRFRLYVGSLAYSTTTAALRQAFGEFGTLLDAEVVFDRANHSKGFGFVSYGDEESMKKAIDKMNGFELDGRKLEVTVAMPQGPKFGMNGGYMQRGGMEMGRGPPRGYRIVIHGVPPTITWRNLKDYLREAGCEVKYADIIGPGVGYAWFQYGEMLGKEGLILGMCWQGAIFVVLHSFAASVLLLGEVLQEGWVIVTGCLNCSKLLSVQTCVQSYSGSLAVNMGGNCACKDIWGCCSGNGQHIRQAHRFGGSILCDHCAVCPG
eukprot:evm.model.scf_3324.1 EVM.evm.TU.scf_3324.1   scf_3324:3357-5452(+)